MTSQSRSVSPLSGIRVLDMTNVLAGPFACQQLAHLGAEVIKIEIPGRGDLARQLGASRDLSADLMGVSFLAQNAGKGSVELDLKTDEGKADFLALVATSDVVVENFRPGVMDRLGLGWEVLRARKPDLVYCAISGFGQTGPWANRPAYDQIIQGAAGVMAVTGTPEVTPLRVGFPVADTIGGLTAAMSICAALADRGEARFIDVSMLEATVATMGWAVSNWLVAGVPPAVIGNENMTAAPSGAFQTRDGLLNIAANEHRQWEALCRHIGCDHLLTHPDYRQREDRKANRDALRGEIEAALARKSAREWEAELNPIGVPSGAVLKVEEVLASEHLSQRGLVHDFGPMEGVAGQRLSLVASPVTINGQRPCVAAPPPRLGQDTERYLRGRDKEKTR
ncbi:CaiB/BaiF CoA transferase family protein [Falsirhodobacter halotolerans]|uniref:CaiB/BaiF CoA transferase family protein n=1 Tax=Falsirhodobacter halotolerans TaxID=1146892 RepID=UPI001FD2AC2A|nr:CoA transferase [Falsirhodobacter halotolerans]MCJ8138289.1 CoA transferase [Falsirhodobacter halotolerans]MCJ8139117.1 CoA transferase [Falsirhodobacter halotolerans]